MANSNAKGVATGSATTRPMTAIDRFISKVKFDPATGCVIWTGATTGGRGNNVKFGRFWDRGKSHYAHRWAAENIHEIAIDGADIIHECHNTLCVQHLSERPADQGNDARFRYVKLWKRIDPPDPKWDKSEKPRPGRFFMKPGWLTMLERNALQETENDPF